MLGRIAPPPLSMPPRHPVLSPTDNLMRRFAVGVLMLLLSLMPAAPAAAALLHLEGPVPADLGLRSGRLSGCATPAHCSWAEWPVADPQAALEALLPAVLGLDGVTVVETDGDYLHATVTSRVFGFVDDLELHADRERKVLEARSLSRLGDSDLGVNARRLETLHRALITTGSAAAPGSTP
jgi:uncharacterized protein (DUF1499 family)